jgi:hypothetical protein
MAANLTIGTIWIDVSLSEKHSLTAEVTEHPVEDGSAISDNVRPQPRTVQIEGLVTNHPTELPLSHAGGVRASEDAGFIDVTTVPGVRLPPMSHEIQGEPADVGFIPGASQGLAIAGIIPGVLGLDISLPRRRFAAELHNEDREGRTFYAVNALAFSEEFDRVGAVYQALVAVATEPQLVKLVTGLDIYEEVALTDLSFDRSSDTGPNALRFTCSCKVLRIVNAQTLRVPRPAEERGKPGQSRGKQATEQIDFDALSESAKEQGHAAFAHRGLEGIANLWNAR